MGGNDFGKAIVLLQIDGQVGFRLSSDLGEWPLASFSLSTAIRTTSAPAACKALTWAPLRDRVLCLASPSCSAQRSGAQLRSKPNRCEPTVLDFVECSFRLTIYYGFVTRTESPTCTMPKALNSI